MRTGDENVTLARTLDFFGRVTADATHDIKNELAVMNEQGCLLQEMLVMANQGSVPEPGYLEHLAGRLIARLELANQVVRRLNVFAHCADMDNSTQAEMGAALIVLISMYHSEAARHRVTLTFQENQLPNTRINKGLPLLCMAIWACLESVCEAVGPGAVVDVTLHVVEGDAVTCFRTEPGYPLQTPPQAFLEPSGASAKVLEDGVLEMSLPLAFPAQ